MLTPLLSANIYFYICIYIHIIAPIQFFAWLFGRRLSCHALIEVLFLSIGGRYIG